MRHFLAGLAGLFGIAFLAPAVHAQAVLDQSINHNYVVIGAFAVQSNAAKFAESAKKLLPQVSYQFNEKRKLYYVVLMDASQKESAMAEARRLREETQYADSWVYCVMIDPGPVTRTEEINPVTEQPISSQPVESTPVIASTAPVVETQPNAQPTEVKAETKKFVVTNPAAKGFILKAYRSVDNAPVEGEIDMVDAKKGQKLSTHKTNEFLELVKPNTATGDIAFISDIFGYRKVQKDLNFNNPEASDITKNEDGVYEVPFELIRLQKGDIGVMYNVYFFKDAAVMRPESTYEVNRLLTMMKENPNYKIKLHGHTNGNSSGRILFMGGSKNYFSLNDTREGYGSAKKLSEERAKIIMTYLLDNGITPDRMSIKAWGGKRPIHDKVSSRANENVRVEVEIVED